MKTLNLILIFVLIVNMNFAQTYTMPHENEEHEGTWLQWPHQYEYGSGYRNSLDATWVAMTEALVAGEKVHIVAYNNTEKNRIINLLTAASISLSNVDFYIFQTNDVWIRDNGPIFVRDNVGDLRIEDWGFNGWGGKYDYQKCDPIPTSIATALNIPAIDLNSIMTNEGGAVEIDGHGVIMACKSSIISQAPTNSIRNLGMNEIEAEAIFMQYLGATKLIWLDGKVGDANDVTDFHIDGFVKFVDDSILVTMNNDDLIEWGTTVADISALYNASNVNDITYTKVYLPLTQDNVVTTSSVNLGYKGSYVNYYVANGVVLVPNYNDPSDAVANVIIQNLYPERSVIGIDCRNLYENGGMVHCVTQQQPLASSTGVVELKAEKAYGINIFPNPFNDNTTIQINTRIEKGELNIYNLNGRKVRQIKDISGNTISFSKDHLPAGIYFIDLTQDHKRLASGKMVIE